MSHLHSLLRCACLDPEFIVGVDVAFGFARDDFAARDVKELRRQCLGTSLQRKNESGCATQKILSVSSDCIGA